MAGELSFCVEEEEEDVSVGGDHYFEYLQPELNNFRSVILR